MKSNKSPFTRPGALPFLQVDVIAPTPSTTPLPPEYNSNDAIAVSINHNNVKVNYNIDYENVQNVCIPRNANNEENSTEDQTHSNSNKPEGTNFIENNKKDKNDIDAPQVLLETSFDQLSKSLEEIPILKTVNTNAERNLDAQDNEANDGECSSIEYSMSNQCPNKFLGVEDSVVRKRELRPSIRSTRSERLSVDHTTFDRRPLRSSFRSSRPERKSLSLSIPYESNKVIIQGP